MNNPNREEINSYFYERVSTNNPDHILRIHKIVETITIKGNEIVNIKVDVYTLLKQNFDNNPLWFDEYYLRHEYEFLNEDNNNAQYFVDKFNDETSMGEFLRPTDEHSEESKTYILVDEESK